MYAAATATEDQSIWMEQLGKRGKSTTKLIDLCLPGSHNSGSYSLSVDMPMAPDAPEIARFFDSTSIRQLVKNWSRCQKVGIGEQLKLGIRYFDFRVAFRSESGEFHAVHGLFGPKVTEMVLEILEFVSDHPKEILILDFNHFYAMGNADHLGPFGPDRHGEFCQMLKEMMGTKIFPCDGRQIADVTVESVWDKKSAQILCIYHPPAEFAKSLPAEFWAAPPSIESPWAQTEKLDPMMQHFSSSMECKRNGKLINTVNRRIFAKF